MLLRTSTFALAVLLAGCGGLQVQTDYDPEADFAGWETYRWAERTDEGRQDPRVYNDITASRVKLAVNRALEAKGYREVSSGSADFVVAWHGAIDEQVSVNTVNTYYGYGWGWYGPGVGTSQTYVNTWNEGTLVIDIVDVSANQLVWRGMGTDTLGGEKSPEETQRLLDQATAKIMADFPPGAGN